MVIDGSIRDEEPVGDLGVGHAVGQMAQHLELPSSQTEGVVPGGPGRSPGYSVHPRLGQLRAQTGCHRNGTEIVEDPQRLDPGVGRLHD